jgi:motility quorum-sensing regulator / GCU-specific mRNA interferase toxin
VEKRKSHYLLSEIQSQMTSPERLRMTYSARAGITELDWSAWDAVRAVQGLSHEDYYKSMTSYADAATWQDVYHAHHLGIALYVKFVRDGDGFFTISFKRLSDVDER